MSLGLCWGSTGEETAKVFGEDIEPRESKKNFFFSLIGSGAYPLPPPEGGAINLIPLNPTILTPSQFNALGMIGRRFINLPLSVNS
jgi:hypothetical protein